MDELTPERMREIEARWKSDVDFKLDALIADAKAHREKYDAFIDMLIKREQRREKVWDAIIDKGLTMLIIAAVVSLFSLAWTGALGEIRSLIANGRSGK